LLLYTDCLSEAENETGEYGTERINDLLLRSRSLEPGEMINKYLVDVRAFPGKKETRGETTILLIRRN
jgi:serine phosphatase RsbU (regulator of sigma subunit)